jgi:ERF superfamily protein
MNDSAQQGPRDYREALGAGELPNVQYIAGRPTFCIEGDRTMLFGALAQAQGSFGAITKNRTVHVQPRDGRPYSFDYATLDVVLEACRPALNANGLALIQPFTADGDDCEIRTMLCHASGAYIELAYRFAKPEAIQKLGSVLTYVRRYSVSCLLGVSSEEDDDGNAADGNAHQASPRGQRMQPDKPAPKVQPKAQPKPVAVEQPNPSVSTQVALSDPPASFDTSKVVEATAEPVNDINGPDGEALPEDDIDPSLPRTLETEKTVRATMTRLFSLDGSGNDLTMALRSLVFKLATGKGLVKGDPYVKSEHAGRKMIDLMYELAAEHSIDPDVAVSRTNVQTMLKALSKRAGVQ